MSFDDRVRALMDELARSSSATQTLGRWAGTPLVIELDAVKRRRLSPAEAGRLEVTGPRRCCARSGRLRSTNDPALVAKVSSTVLMSRLPRVVKVDLRRRSDPDPQVAMPLGLALARRGYPVRRQSVVHRLDRGEFVIRASNRLWLGEIPIALTEELIPAEFVRRARPDNPDERRSSTVTENEILNVVRDVLVNVKAESSPISPAEVTRELPLDLPPLGLDSMDFIRLIAGIEEKLGVLAHDDEFVAMTTVDDLIGAVRHWVANSTDAA